MPTPFTPTISKVYSIWTSGTGAVTVASPSTGPTSAQITAATDLTGYGMKGWSGGDESPYSIATGQAATFNVTITPAAVFEFALP